jgi:glyoxylase-like metal-dependent hydrolase (beta-lactamase superfamily II)
MTVLTKIIEGIYLLKVQYPGGMGATNCYLVEGEQGYTIIDTGSYSKQAKSLWQQVLDKGVAIEKVVLTHVHQDHIGLAKWLQKKGIPIIVSKIGLGEMEKHRDPDFENRMAQLLRVHGIANIPESLDRSDIYQFEPDVLFNMDERIKIGNDWYEPIWTPGHSYDHFCFYNPEKRFMFAGDHVLQEFSPVIGLWEAEEYNALQYYLQSIDHILQYPTDFALTGHGEPIEHFHDRVLEIKEGHEKRLEQIYQLVKEEAKTALQITYDVYGQLKKNFIASPFMASLTRLIYLEEQGKVRRYGQNGVYTFKAVN